ncbi:MAG TPA: glycine cleavage system aminomethyltransferase GcvT [Gemmatimonadota bacterium]|nr:glycine cleavage system aminomethyltransferase GcvT [Gemmatimonadota bacterium]
MSGSGGSGRVRRTPLYDEHVRLGAKLVPFGGFAMPVQYPSGIRAEHEAVRSAAGLFDVSHMGEFRVEGPGAVELVSHLTTNDPARLSVGQAQYSTMCGEDGGVLDDLVVYRLGEELFRLVVNAANIAGDWEHVAGVASRAGFEAELSNRSEEIALLALQGPRAEAILAPLASVSLEPIGFYRFAEGQVDGVPSVISRTGYTGEDGFELYLDAGDAAGVWRRLLEAGQEEGLVPAGLGARDTLRLEMGYALYGNDIDRTTTPLEAGLGWLVKLDKGPFIGREALRRQKDEGPARRLRGFRLTERGFPRAGYPVRYEGSEAGPVRSGTVSPSLGYGIGTAYLPVGASAGDELAVVIREDEVAGRIEEMPFYREGSLKR